MAQIEEKYITFIPQSQISQVPNWEERRLAHPLVWRPSYGAPENCPGSNTPCNILAIRGCKNFSVPPAAGRLAVESPF